jgi:hypothetical protein
MWANSKRYPGRGSHSIILDHIDWDDFDHNGDLLRSDHGDLWRLPEKQTRLVAASWAQMKTRAKRLIDFTDRAFEKIAAPYAGVIRAGPKDDEPTPAVFSP